MESNRNNYTPFNQNELSAADKDFKQFVSPQRTSIAKDYLGMAEQTMSSGDVKLAGEYLKKFSDVSGFAVKELDKSKLWFGNPYVKNNMKYLRDVSLQYNMHTIKNYMYEAERRGLNQQVQRYAELLDLASKTSITEEAALEVSAHLDKMVSKMKYMDSPSGITRLDLARFAEIQKAHSIDKESIDKAVESSLESYSSKISKGAKDIAGGFLGTFISAIDLAANVVTFATNKKLPSVNEYLMKKIGVNTGSWSYFMGELSTFAFGGEFIKAAQILKQGLGLEKALKVFHATPRLGGMFKRYFYAGTAYLSGQAAGGLTAKIIDNFNIEENRREVLPNIMGAAGMAAAHKANLSSRILGAFDGKSTPESYTINKRRGGGDSGSVGAGTPTEPTRPSGSGGVFGEEVSSGQVPSTEFELNGKRFVLDTDNNFSVPKEKSIVPVEQSAYQKILSKGRSMAIDFMQSISKMKESFSNLIDSAIYGSKSETVVESPTMEQSIYSDKESIIDTPSEVKSKILSDMPSDPRQKMSGKSYEGTFIEESPRDGKSYIKNINPYNIETGAENVSNYNTKIDSTGTTAVLTREIQDVARVIEEQAAKKISEVAHNDVPQMESGIEIIPKIDGVEIKKADEAIGQFAEAFAEEYSISELDARNMERGSANTMLRMLKSEDKDVKALGTALMDVVSYLSLGTDKNSMIINDHISNIIRTNKESIFDAIGINERQVDLTQLYDSRYTGSIAKNAIAEVKEMINAKFNPYFTKFKQSIDNFANVNPVKTQVALDELSDIMRKLDETGRSLAKETKDLYYENVLKKISQKAQGAKFQEIPSLLRDLLRMEIPEETKGISELYRRSLGERLMLVRRYLRTAAQMYDTDTVAGFDAGVGAFGDFKSNIYNPAMAIIDDLMQSVLGEDYSEFEEVNKAYADYAKTRQKIYKIMTDKNLSGEQIWKQMSKDPLIIRELLSHLAGQEVKVDSYISQFRQLIMAEIIRPILNIDSDGNVVFHLRDQKQLPFSKKANIKLLLNDEQISILDDAAENASIIHEYERYRKNNSNTANLSTIRSGLVGKTMSQQIQSILKSDKVMSGIRLAKNIAKLSKKLKAQSLNKFILVFNTLISIIQRAAEDVSSQQTADLMAKIVHVVVDPAMEALALSRSSDSLSSKGFYSKPYNN